MIEQITSHQNPRVKKAIRLHSSRGRQAQGRMIVFGMREVKRAIDAGVQFEELFFDEDVTTEFIQTFGDSNPNASLIQLAETVFEKLAYGGRVDGVVGIASRPNSSLDQVKLSSVCGQKDANLSGSATESGSLVLIGQAIEKPGNLGAMIRSADACGCTAVISADTKTDFYHPNSIRSSTGTVFSMQLAAASTREVKEWLREHQFRVFTALLHGATNFFATELQGNVALVLGNEAEGLDSQWIQPDFHPVKLPMLGRADSLNVSVTASVMLYEAIRQRGQ